MNAVANLPLEVLSRPSFYPHQPAAVELKETHISWIFLAGELVYKCKKPVRFDFLDFSTPELRRQACEDEVRLNRRLAPDTYLGVVPVTNNGGKLQLGGAGTPVEWLVEMRRLPVEQTLEQRLLRGELQPADVDRLAATLAAFYRRLEPAGITAEEYRTGLIRHVQQNRAELLAASHHLPLEQVQRIHARQLQMLHVQPELFSARVSAGRIVEGHGDLRPEHICLTDPLVIFDCIEFSREFRTLDVADELAFLASECDHLGATWVGSQLLEQCALILSDDFSAELVNFYKSYRACVRAKVAALRGDQIAGVAQQAEASQARQYLEQAEGYLQSGNQPLLLVVGGLSGTGKSTLARELGQRLGLEVLRTDVVRNELFSQRSKGENTAEVYQRESREQVYAVLLEHAATRLRAGLSIILDGTFNNAKMLTAANQIAQQAKARFLAIECSCPPEIAKERIAQRLTQGQDASEADVAVYEQQRLTWQPWPADIRRCQMDTTPGLEQQLQGVFRELRTLDA